MTEKRFWYDGTKVFDGDELLCCTLSIWVEQLVDLLNELHEENHELKFILQDMGLLRSNEEVKNVRDEIASKLIKPLCKENGFDVDVNTENGFTIIPKEDFE